MSIFGSIIDATPIAYVPTITAATGAFTTITQNRCEYMKIGNLIAVTLDFTITSVGTASGNILVSAPLTSIGDFCQIGGREVVASGYEIGGTMSSNSFVIRKSDGTSGIIATARLQALVFYRI